MGSVTLEKFLQKCEKKKPCYLAFEVALHRGLSVDYLKQCYLNTLQRKGVIFIHVNLYIYMIIKSKDIYLQIKRESHLFTQLPQDGSKLQVLVTLPENHNRIPLSF